MYEQSKMYPEVWEPTNIDEKAAKLDVSESTKEAPRLGPNNCNSKWHKEQGRAWEFSLHFAKLRLWKIDYGEDCTIKLVSAKMPLQRLPFI